MICKDDLVYNIPNWKFGMLQVEAAKMDVDEDEIEEHEVDEVNSDGYTPPSTEPSWAKKLKKKMKLCSACRPRGSTGPMLPPRRVASAIRRY